MAGAVGLSLSLSFQVFYSAQPLANLLVQMAGKVPKSLRVQTERRLSMESACSLCCHETKEWVISPCDHHICLTCAARLRVLCDTKECPVCRENNEKVIVVEKRQSFVSIPSQRKLYDRKSGFLFESRELYATFESLKIPRCIKCEEGGGAKRDEARGHEIGRPRFTNIKSLQDHLRKDHNLSMCDICVSNLKLFPHEYRLYTREQLARHRREGDPDDSAYKGHPLCQFCDERFLDTETLFFHLKNKHFWCHICEADGSQDYYASYAELRVHFRQAHYLCCEGPCRYEKFTTVFRTKLDFQAHKAKEHCKGLSKAEAKQLRQVDVGFVYSKAPEEVEGMPPVSQRQYHHTRQKKTSSREIDDIETAKALSLTEQKKDTNSARSSSEENSPDQQIKDTHPLSNSCPIVRNTSLPSLSAVKISVEEPPNEWPLLDTDIKTQSKPPPPHLLSSTPVAPPPGLTLTASKPPPGFNPSPPITGPSTLKTEFDIFEMAQRILGNNKKKVNQFRKWSGQYLLGDLTASDYYGHCSDIFGTAWTEFGLQLVETLPDPIKRAELQSLFDRDKKPTTVPPGAVRPPPGLSVTQQPHAPSSRSKNKKIKHPPADLSDSRPWQSATHRSKVSLTEDEFPSLQNTGSKGPDTVTALSGWNVKVAVK